MDPREGAGHRGPGDLGTRPGAAAQEPREGHSQQHQAPLPLQTSPGLRGVWQADDRVVDQERRALRVRGLLPQARAVGVRRTQRHGPRRGGAGLGVRQGAALRSRAAEARYEEGRGDPAIDSEEEREKERIGRKLGALDHEVGHLIDAYQADVIDLAELKERRERIEEHGRMLRRRLSEIREKRAEREQEIRLLRGLEQFSESLQAALEDPSFEIKQQGLRLVDRIVVEDARMFLHHVVPTALNRLQTERQPSHNP